MRRQAGMIGRMSSALAALLLPLAALLIAAPAPAVAADASDVETVAIDWLPGSRFEQGGLLRGQVAPDTRVWRGERELRVDGQGRFVVGLHRDAPERLRLRLQPAKGAVVERAFPIDQRDYDEQRIDGLPNSMVTPSESVLQRISEEAEKVRAARAHDSGLESAHEGFAWPVTGRITSVYGSRRILNGEPRQPHYGIDIAAPEGRPIRATAGGIVRMAEADLYYTGGTVIIDHGHGLSSTYLHMSRLDVAGGDRVVQGETIGAVGATGRVTGAHLCFRYNWFDKRLDPALLLPEDQSTTEETAGHEPS